MHNSTIKQSMRLLQRSICSFFAMPCLGQHLLMQHEGIVHHQKKGEHARREEETPERNGIVIPDDGIGEE